MATIINALEIVVDTPQESAPDGGAAPAPAEPPRMRPVDVRDVLEQQLRRETRLFAH